MRSTVEQKWKEMTDGDRNSMNGLEGTRDVLNDAICNLLYAYR